MSDKGSLRAAFFVMDLFVLIYYRATLTVIWLNTGMLWPDKPVR